MEIAVAPCPRASSRPRMRASYSAILLVQWPRNFFAVETTSPFLPTRTAPAPPLPGFPRQAPSVNRDRHLSAIGDFIPVDDPVAVRTADELLGALKFVVQLGRQIHVAAAADGVPGGYDGDSVAAALDHFVPAPQVGLQTRDQGFVFFLLTLQFPVDG